MDHLKRCKACGKWTDGTLSFCTFCGYEHDREYKKEVQKRKDAEESRIPILRIHDSDPTWLKILKRPIQMVQLVLYAIIAFLVYLSTAFAH